MTRNLKVHFLPELTDQNELAGSLVVIIDILRASTTITYALGNGAKQVVPFQTVEDVQAWKAEQTEPVLLGGERGGKPIDGFDFGNTPDAYSQELVQGKSIGFTTTNGTKAMLSAKLAEEVIIGCYCNLDVIVKYLLASSLPVHLLCAGTNGAITREDILFAGQVASLLLEQDTNAFKVNDEATMAVDAYKQIAKNDLATELRNTQGGRNLIGIGLQRDIGLVARENCYPIIPKLDIKQWSIQS